MDGGGIFDIEIFGGMGSVGFGLDVPYQQGGKSFVGKPGTGAHCSDPKAMQQMLNDLGFNAGTVDGQVGNNTLKAMKAFAASVGMPDPGFGAKGAVCEALMAAWQAVMMPSPPSSSAPSPVPSVPTTTQPKTTAGLPKRIPKKSTTPVSVFSSPKAWWDSQSTNMKVGVGVGAVVVVGAVGYVAFGGKKSATPNRRRRRRRAQ